MKGAAPQKGFKMPFKLSITEGPVVDGVIVGMLSMDHIREITTFLCDWYEQIESVVTNHIEVIIVSPQKGPNNSCRIIVKVVLFGNYARYNQAGEAEFSQSWKSSFEECFYNYSPNEPGDLIGDKEELIDRFNKRLIRTIEFEVKTYQSLLNELNSVLKCM